MTASLKREMEVQNTNTERNNEISFKFLKEYTCNVWLLFEGKKKSTQINEID